LRDGLREASTALADRVVGDAGPATTAGPDGDGGPRTGDWVPSGRDGRRVPAVVEVEASQCPLGCGARGGFSVGTRPGRCPRPLAKAAEDTSRVDAALAYVVAAGGAWASWDDAKKAALKGGRKVALSVDDVRARARAVGKRVELRRADDVVGRSGRSVEVRWIPSAAAADGIPLRPR